MKIEKEKVVITGGTGFLGINLARALIRLGYSVTLIARNEPEIKGPWAFAQWDGRSLGSWKNHLNGAKAIVNLAGKTVDCIKTPENCDLILRSRVESTAVIGQAIRSIDSPPAVWVQMSTAHIYGDPPAVVCSEESAFGHGLAPFVGKAWEEAFQQAVLPSMRQVILRTSFVLGPNGGALPTLAKMARFGLGGKAGHGEQGISWIHEQDMNNIFLAAIENRLSDASDRPMEGAYIATAPNPVPNREFMQSLRKTVGRPFGLPAAPWMVKFAARFLLKTDPDLVLCGRYIVPKRLEKEGFQFEFPDINSTLAHILSS